MRTGLGMSLDWLSFTFKPNFGIDMEQVDKDWTNMSLEDKAKYVNKAHYLKEVRYFGTDRLLDDLNAFWDAFPEFWEIREDFCVLAGRSHYEHVIGFLGVSETCRISYNTSGYSEFTDMGVNVCIPSHGLEWFFTLMGIDIELPNAVQLMFKELKDRNCHASRIDLAFDDFDKVFRPRDYIKWWWDGCLRTRFRTMRTASSLRDVGNTFYLGSRTTGKMLRVYDKDVESQGAIDAVRYEMELHMHHAKDMFEYLIDNATIDFSAYLRSFLEVLDMSSGRRKDYCPLLPAWETWLTKMQVSRRVSSEKLEIPKYTLSQRKKDVCGWLLYAAGRSIKGFVRLFGWDELKNYVNNDNRSVPDSFRILEAEMRKSGHLIS